MPPLPWAGVRAPERAALPRRAATPLRRSASAATLAGEPACMRLQWGRVTGLGAGRGQLAGRACIPASPAQTTRQSQGRQQHLPAGGADPERAVYLASRPPRRRAAVLTALPPPPSRGGRCVADGAAGCTTSAQCCGHGAGSTCDGSGTCQAPDGRNVVCWGSNSDGQTTVPASLSDAVEITAGAYHTCARRGDATVECWGACPCCARADAHVRTAPCHIACRICKHCVAAQRAPGCARPEGDQSTHACCACCAPMQAPTSTARAPPRRGSRASPGSRPASSTRAPSPAPRLSPAGAATTTGRARSRLGSRARWPRWPLEATTPAPCWRTTA